MKRLTLIFIIALHFTSFGQNFVFEEYTGAWINSVVLYQDSIAYCSGSGYFYSFDISDPLNPQLLYKEELEYGTLYKMFLKDDYLISHTSRAFLVFDISNPYSPFIEYVNNEIPRSTIAYENNLLITANTHNRTYDSLYIFDFSDVHSPVLLSTLHMDMEIFDLALNGTNAVVTGAFSDQNIKFFDLANPSDPVFISALNGAGFYANPFFIKDSLMVVSKTDQVMFTVFNISDLTHPTLLSYRTTGFYPLTGVRQPVLLNDYIVVPTGVGIYISNFDDPANPGELTLITQKHSFGFAIQNDNLITGTIGGLQIVELISPFNTIGEYGLPAPIRYPQFNINSIFFPHFGKLGCIDFSEYRLKISESELANALSRGDPFVINDDYLFVNSRTEGGLVFYELAVFERGGNNQYYQVASLDINKINDEMQVNDNLLVAIDLHSFNYNYYTDVSIFDMSNHGNPSLLSEFTDSVYINQWTFDNNYLYMMSADDIFIYDISNASNPVLAYNEKLGDFYSSYLNPIIYDGRIYIAVSNGLRSYQFSNESGLVTVDSIDFEDNNYSTRDMIIVNDKCILSSSRTITTYDISTPGNPVLLDTTDINIDVRKLVYYNSRLYLITNSSGIFIYTDNGVVPVKDVDNLSTPETFALEQNYPNPFNPSTSIRFSLPERTNVTLSVFNILGEKVSELVNGTMEVGSHELHFNAAGLSSGIYYYRLQAGSFSETKKMLLIK